MNKRTALLVLLIGTIIVLPMVEFVRVLRESRHSTPPEVFVGVEIAYDNIESCKKTIDKVKDYTNLFIVGATGITLNETKVNLVCEYAYSAGLYFILFMWPTTQWPNQTQWVTDAKIRWGECFLGLYAQDEWGGHQVDNGKYMLVKEANNYTDAAKKFIESLKEILKHYTTYHMNTTSLKLFTADYALYWFDYDAGYDVVLCEFGWNHSRLLNIALCRGAASVHNKEWGVIITWTYRQQPYLESADELYYDMVSAYLSGAKYIIVFNYPEISPYGVLTEKHFDAIKKFWSYTHTNPPSLGKAEQRIAYVLPKDYGWAFRGSEDKVWGLWTDELSTKIGTDVDFLLHTHHIGLDIIYDDPKYYSAIMLQYYKLIFWNGTIIS
jgi:hypothetical protein